VCGFFGFVDFSGSAGSADHEEVRKGAESIRYRGPDAFGASNDAYHSIGFCRLSIIDLSAPSQPYSNDQNTVTMVCNGEIYNYTALREELKHKGHVFHTKTDSEVVLRGYEEWGDSLWPRLTGIFAIALWDAAARKLYLVRDHLGVKPIHYMKAGNRIYFASDYNAFFHQSRVTVEPNPDAILSYVSFRYVIGAQTFYKNITDVLAGHSVMFDGPGSEHDNTYWDIPTETGEDRGEAYYLDELERLLSENVTAQLMSDVPLGAFISGGLDSSLLLHFMKAKHENIHAYAAGFPEADYNEFPFVDTVADHLGINPTKITLAADDFAGSMDEVNRFRGEPASIPHEAGFLAMAKVMKKDVSVVLSGEGADELFAGYGRIFRSPLDYRKGAMLNGWPEGAARCAGSMMGIDASKTHASPQKHFLSRYSWFTNSEKHELLNMERFSGRNFDPASEQYLAQLFDTAGDASYSRTMYYLQGKIHLPNLLNRLDRMTMAASIEGRVPFLDHNFVAFASRMPGKYKLRWKNALSPLLALGKHSNDISENLDTPKYILKRLATGKIPDSIIWRRKMGFPVPLDRWFNTVMRERAREMLTDPGARIRDFINVDGVRKLLSRDDMTSYYDYNGKKIWMLMNLELWMQRYFA